MRFNQANLEPSFTDAVRSMILGPNDGGVKRGDRTDTGDEQARPNILDTGELPISEDEAIGNYEEGSDPDANEMEIVSPFNPRSGVTNTSRRPADDWAADTGPAQTPESIRED